MDFEYEMATKSNKRKKRKKYIVRELTPIVFKEETEEESEEEYDDHGFLIESPSP